MEKYRLKFIEWSKWDKIRPAIEHHLENLERLKIASVTYVAQRVPALPVITLPHILAPNTDLPKVQPLVKTRTLLLRLLAACYTMAFSSLYIQIPGLYGENGILPARSALDRSLPKLKPTLLWFAPNIGLNTEYMMDLLCLIGMIMSIVITLKPSLGGKTIFLILWGIYLSLFQVGQIFIWCAWDLLLLEFGFLAVILAPYKPATYKEPLPTDNLTMFLLRWLLFRITFVSGVTKLQYGIRSWWDLTALKNIYEIQYLPTPIAWFFYHLPDFIHKACVVAGLVIELFVSFLYFAPTDFLRKCALFCQISVNVFSILVGNYSFLHFLYIALDVSLMNDSWFEKPPTEPSVWKEVYHVMKKEPGTVESGETDPAISNPFRNRSNFGARLLRCLKENPSLLTSVLSAVLTGLFNFCVIMTLTYVTARYFFCTTFSPHFSIEPRIMFTKKEFLTFVEYSAAIGLYLASFSLFCIIWKSLYQAVTETPGVKQKIGAVFVTCGYIVLTWVMFFTSIPTYTLNIDITPPEWLPSVFTTINHNVDDFELINPYGVYQTMSGAKGRPEVVLEGSNSVRGPWEEFHFMYKPGDIRSAPVFCSPHQPRLDWEMWFSAIGRIPDFPWLYSLAYRILTNETTVLRLLDIERSPFPRDPPKYVRAQIYYYRFTDMGEGSEDVEDNWWIREHLYQYMPVFVATHEPLVNYLTQMGVLWATPEPVSNTVIKGLLDWIRGMTRDIKPHLFVWAVSWLTVPVIWKLGKAMANAFRPC